MPPQLEPHLIIVIPPAAGRHLRARVFAVLRRALAVDPDFYLVTGRTPVDAPAWPARGAVPAGADQAVVVLTQQLRRIAAGYIASLPAGLLVSSHSWREMGAVACWHACYDSTHMAAHGFWNKVDTMWSSYIKPFVAVFPYSLVLTELFDWLQSC